MKEIGSEFWFEKSYERITNNVLPKWLKIGDDNRLLLSGRTALHMVLQDIQKNKKVNTVYFPSYCCQSMLQPFIDLGIEIIFYDVNVQGELTFNININKQCDIFFAMNYFGYNDGRMDRYIELFKERDTIVIEDSTHSLLSDVPYNLNSDYIVASLRKWFPIISGGLAIKTSGEFTVYIKEETNNELVDIRKLAMVEKSKYINGDLNINKDSFLKKYGFANNELNRNYELYNIDKESFRILCELDIDLIKMKRKENVRHLYGNLKDNKVYNYVFPELKTVDCPIFVPLIFSRKVERDNLRKYLIDKNIYFPVHWPKPTLLNSKGKNNIFDYELSVVVDQRYSTDDMEYVIRRITEFYE